MYVPKHFAEEDVAVLSAFVREHRFATLVSPGAGGLVATHLPMLWDPEPVPYGTLTGHVARANPHGRELAADVDSLAIFSGPQAYVSPSWYPAKREHGKVVPTWNYVAVHAYGRARPIEDAGWLRRFVTRLTDVEERVFAEPWRVTDAPEAYVAQMLKGIVGIEMPLTRLEGKWKLGQNRSPADYEGAIDGLAARDDAGARAVAGEMRAWKRAHRGG